ncbi:hypothetical protein EIP86_005658 [Pleurotus ostreatoroseus]|nr:hypothetical protein EIP86_005658 [Pleurotus ostreatoroseus]
MNGVDASPAIKRAARTYGKPRKVEPEPEQDYDDAHDTSFATSSNGDASHDSIPESPGGSIPPDSSDNEPLLDSSMVRDDEGEFMFGWKKRLQDIDNDDDLEGAPPPGELALKLTQIDREEVSRNTISDPPELFEPEHISSPSKTRSRLTTNDMSRTSPTSSPDAGPSKARTRRYKSAAFSVESQPDDEPDKREDVTTSGRSHARSPSPLTRRVRRRRTVFDSDSSSDSGAAEDKGRRARVRARATGRETSASAETSPDKLHHINSPQARPSQTPPSSQEMPPKRAVVVDSFVPPPRFVGKVPTAKDKGKTKADNANREKGRDNEEDAGSGGEPGSPGEGGTRGQSRRKKKLSKKEQLEAEKATTRLKAEQSAQLKATTKPLKVTAMLGTIKPQASSTKAKSSPITPQPPQKKFTLVGTNPLIMERIPNPRRKPIAHSTLGVPTASTSRAGSTGLGSGRSTTAERSRTTTPAGFDDADNPLYRPDDRTAPAARRKSAHPTPSFRDDPSHADDSSEEELPTTADIIEEDQRKRSDAERKRALAEWKAAALEKIEREKATRHESDKDDSDLDVVADDAHERVREETRARQANKPRESRGHMLQRTYAKVKNPVTTRGDSGQADDPFARNESRMQHMRDAASSGFITRTNTGPKPSRGGKSRAGVNARELNRALLQSANEQSRQITRQKEYEFYRGERNALPGDQWRETVQREDETEARKRQALEEYVDRAYRNAEKREAGQDDEEDDEEDGEYVPEQEEDEEDGGSVSAEEPATTQDQGEDEDDDDENDENVLPASHRHTGPSRVIVDSDEEDNLVKRLPPARVASQGRILVPNSSQPNSPQPSRDVEEEEFEDEDAQMPDFEHRPSLSSAEDTDRFEEGTDKENNELLKFDCGEDKENTVISQQPSSPSDIGFRLLRRGPSALLSPDVRSRESNRLPGVRSPLQEIPREDEDDEDDPFGPPKPNVVGFSSSPPRASRHTTPKPLQGFATPRPLTLGGGLDGFFGDGFSAPAAKTGANPFQTPGAASSSLEPAAVILPGSGGLGFSQFDDEKPQGNIFAAPKGLQERGFSQFATPVVSAFFDDDAILTRMDQDGKSGKLGKLRQPAMGTMVLSVDEQRAQLTLNEELLGKADELFEKQQEVVVGAALVPDSSKAQKMYINNHGFYTQNKPDSARKETPWTKRAPLAPLPVEVTPFVMPGDDEDEMPQSEMPVRGRIMKRAITPEDGSGRDSSPSPSPQGGKGKGRARNAFDVLGAKPLKALPLHKPKKKLDKSEFIEGEAVESDEEHVFGFGPSKKDDDEEADGEDQDGVLQELMDDRTMDADTLNEDAVMEKVKEHQAADDAQAHKRAVDATEGKMRRRRRERGLDFNSSDSENDGSDNDDPSAKRRREKMRKKRKIDGDTLDDLEKHVETKPFVQAYRTDLEDDNDEFSYMQEDDFTSLPLGNDEADMDEDEDEDDDEPRESVSAAALREELRDAIRHKDTKAIPTIDPEDISWVDNDDMDVLDDDVQIKEISTTTKHAPRAGQAHGMEIWEMARASRGGSAQDVAREQRWARSEGGSRNAGTGRGSAAVTSLVQSKSSSSSKTGVKAGGGSITGRRLGKAMEAPQPQAGSSTRRGASLGKTQSALSSSALSRRGKFAK